MYIGPSSLRAQGNQYLRVKAGDNPSKVLSANAKYRYPAFLPGSLIFTNNSTSTAKFNYNMLLSEMHFIDPKGDTLAIANDPTIQAVRIEKDVYYYEFPKTYWVLLYDYGTAKLMGKQSLALIDSEKEGGYGQSTGSSSITNKTTFSSSNSSIAKLNNQADMLFSKKTAFRLMDNNRKFYTTNQGGFLSLFSKNKQIIKQYLREKPLDFGQEEDLKKLLDYCASLPN
jgi:hypothetical protein